MLLKPYRVLDLTSRHGMLCAQILGDLGADVIQIEPPGGAAGREQGPFFEGRVDPEFSLNWWGYARGKRSIELDIDAEREVFLRLVARADFLVESEPVGSLVARGIGHDVLAQHNPALIHVSMTPFGSSGPKAGWAATDLTLLASAGPLALTGDDDRPPVRVSVDQAWNHVAAEGAAGALVALHDRAGSGLGQHVEVSVQQALTIATQGYVLSAAVNEETATRTAGGMKAGDLMIRLTFPAKDGQVSITLLFGATIGPATRRLMEYVCEQGFCDEATRDKDWLEYGLLITNGDEPMSEWERVKDCVAACTASKTKAELLEVAMQRRLLLAPMSTVADVVDSEQFASRQYFRCPDGDGPSASVNYPGAFAKFSETPFQAGRRPPRVGEHSSEVLAELASVPPISLPGVESKAGELPLKGVKVLDLMWALAGPAATRMLADYGATVVRVESTSRLDVCRTIRPFIDSDESPEKSAIFHSTNAGKCMLTVDLTKPEGREVILDLVRWADVVAESFSPRAMQGLGLDYATLRKVNPKIIMLSTCLMGQTGPLSMFAGYGNLSAAISGFYEITGWPDREPAGPFGAYTDYIAPRFNAAAILAALDYRKRTGKGQYIDLAQSEAALHFLTPAILDYTANNVIQSRRGNRDPHAAPHGVYATSGQDNHIAIGCETEVHWQALCSVLTCLDVNDARFKDLNARLTNEDELDSLVAAAIADLDATDLETALQSVGVPASVVLNSPELWLDPQLAHQGHFIRLPHPEGGETVIEASRIHLSRSATFVDSSAPTFSRDMADVLNNLLGYDDEKFGQLLVAGALE